MQNIQKLYQDLHEGKISRNQFLFQIRKDSRINSFFTSANSYDETVRILKNRGLLFEIKTKTITEGEDHEVAMAQTSLDSIIRSASELKDKIGKDEIDIPAWVQDHITNSENYIDHASQGYHEYENDEEESNEEEEDTNQLYNNDLNEAKEPTKGADQVNPYELEKGTYYELDRQKDGAKDTDKAKAKALKNLNKNPKYYSDLLSKDYNDKPSTSDQMQVVKESLKSLIADILSEE